MKQPYIVLMGPTASGKTDLALEIVQHWPCEIVSVDSAMVYRGMDIGTAKPCPTILRQFPHHLIDIRDPADPFSAAEFCQAATQAMQIIHSKGRIPLLVGGTGLYFRSLQQGLSELPPADPEGRQKLVQQAAEVGWEALHQRLADCDPISAKRIHPHDSQRIQRALEVYELTGCTMTEWFAKSTHQMGIRPTIKIVLTPTQRHVLHDRIAQRFKTMLRQGFIEEVYQLYQRSDLDLNKPALKAVGYRQVWQYLAGDYDEQRLMEKGIAATRQLAKRQLTWLRAEQEAHWIESQHPNLQQQVHELLDPLCSSHL